MSGNGRGPEPSQRITLCIMKGGDGDLIVESVQESQPDVRVTDRGPYMQLQNEVPIVLDVVDIGDRKGTTMSVQDVLVSFSSIVGRIEIEGDEIRLTPDLPNMQR